MRSYLIILLLVSFFSKATSQTDKQVTISELAAISDNSDFARLVNLCYKLSYKMFDSSKSKDGSLFYYAREPKKSGNILSCNLKGNNNMNMLGFYTTDSSLNNVLIKEITDLGYTTKGKTKFKIEGYEETQEFNKDKKVIAWNVTKKEDGRLEYGFEFIRF